MIMQVKNVFLRNFSGLCKISYSKKQIYAVVGGILEAKGQDVILDALTYLSVEERSKIEIWIIGTIGDRKYAEAIKERAKIFIDEGCVDFRGELSREEMSKIYPLIDVIIMPSRNDPMPIAVTEGLMKKKLCIVSSTVGTASFIKSYKNGIIFESGNAKALSEEIRWIQKNKSEAEKIGENGRIIYDEHFSMNSFQSRLLSFLNDQNKASD